MGQAGKTFDDNRAGWYDHLIRKNPDGTPERFLSVTTALEIIEKPALRIWATKGAAARAMDALPTLIRSQLVEPCGRTNTDQRCMDCPDCKIRWVAGWHFAESQRAKVRGSAIHDVKEGWVATGMWPAYSDEIAPYIDQFKQFIEDYGLTPQSWELNESTVLNRAHGYAGTLDGAIRILPTTPKATELCQRLGKPGGVLVLEDTKTREKPEAAIWPDMPLQLAAYRRCPVIMLRDGTELPMPDTDGAAILQLRPPAEDGQPGSYTFRPVVTDDGVFGAFLHALGLYRHLRLGPGAESVLVRAFPLPTERPEPAPATRRRTELADAAAGGWGGPTEASPVATENTQTPRPAARTPATRKPRETRTETTARVRDRLAGARQALGIAEPGSQGKLVPDAMLPGARLGEDDVPFFARHLPHDV